MVHFVNQARLDILPELVVVEFVHLIHMLNHLGIMVKVLLHVTIAQLENQQYQTMAVMMRQNTMMEAKIVLMHPE